MNIQSYLFPYFERLKDCDRLLCLHGYPRANNLRELYDFLITNHLIPDHVVQACIYIDHISIQNILVLTQFHAFNYYLYDNRLRNVYGIGLASIAGGDFPVSISFLECNAISQELAGLAFSSGCWATMAQSQDPVLVGYLKVLRTCCLMAGYFADQNFAFRYQVSKVGLQCAYINLDYFNTPSKLGTLSTDENALLDTCKNGFQKMCMSRQLIYAEKACRRDPDMPDVLVKLLDL